MMRTFNENISDLCGKASIKVKAVARITPYINQ